MKKIELIISAGIIILYLLLSFKNPFASKSLVANLEPYPDTLYYSVPAWNFIKGDGFLMKFNQSTIKQVTPPLYSLYLVPFLAIFRDVRAFYFANQLLLVASFVLYIFILKKLFSNNIILIIFSSILLLTNFYIFTFPSLLLAENITIFLFLLGVYFLMTPTTYKKNLTLGLLAISFIFVKFSNLPLTLLFVLFAFLKMADEKKQNNNRIFFISLTASTTLFAFYLFSSKVLVGHKNLQPDASFSINYFKNNLSFYIKILLGLKDSSVLWFSEYFSNLLVFCLSILGFITGLLSNTFRKTVFILGSFLFGQLLFMSFFKTPDARYILAVYPVLTILSSLPLFLMFARRKKSLALIVAFLLAIYFIFPVFNYRHTEPLAVSLKKQIGLNFLHKEDPWYYLAVQEFNGYFKKNNISDAYLATVLPPFFVNFYTNGSYHYLPLNHHQEFFNLNDELTKKMNLTSSMNDYFKTLIKNGKKVYITNAYINNLEIWKKDYETTNQLFETRLVKEGCLGTCNIYELVR